MPARDYSTPQHLPPFPLDKYVAGPSDHMSSRRRIRMQAMTDLYAALDSDPNPEHIHTHCSVVYELNDRSKPSVSSF